MTTISENLRYLGLAAAFAITIGTTNAHGAIPENKAVIIYSSTNSESVAIRDAYLAVHPNVRTLDLNLPYHCPALPEQPPGEDDITTGYITPAGFLKHVKPKITAFLHSTHNIPYVFVTTRGLPAGICNNFDVPPHGTLSFEASIARMGSLFVETDFTQIPNPYYRKLGVAFQDFMNDTCPNGGASLLGKVFLVSRLDAGSCCAEPLEEVKKLITRSQSLIVNKFGPALVLDDYLTCALVSDDQRGFGYLCQHGWCVEYDNTVEFLHGANLQSSHCPSCGPYGLPINECGLAVPECISQSCGRLSSIENGYQQGGRSELLHVSMGVHHSDGDCGGLGEMEDRICTDYVKDYRPDPAGLFLSIESFNGWALHRGGGDFTAAQGNYQGSVVDWIVAGGSFTCGNVGEPGGPGFCAHADFAAPNLYVLNMTWAESIYSSLPLLGQSQTPIGDPLATVTVMNPDLNGDRRIDVEDLAIQNGSNPVDINQDGVISAKDMKVIENVLGRDCSSAVCLPPTSVSANCLNHPNRWLCRGDVNNDARVNSEDWNLLVQYLGCAHCPDLDVDGSGVIDLGDIKPATIIGDIDGNGILDCNDYLLIAAPSFPDTNCDGVIDQIDQYAVIICRGDVTGGPNGTGDGVTDCLDADEFPLHYCTSCPNNPFDMNCDSKVDCDDLNALNLAIPALGCYNCPH